MMNRENGLPYWMMVGDLMADSGIIQSVIDQVCLDIGSDGMMYSPSVGVGISGSADKNLPDWARFAEVLASVVSVTDLCVSEPAC